YGNREAMLDTYRQFITQRRNEGKLITKQTVLTELGLTKSATTYTYALTDAAADFYASSIYVEAGFFCFDLNFPNGKLEKLKLGLPGRHNVENAIAATAAAMQVGLSVEAVRKGLESFKGVQRRFDYRIRDERVVYIDDYGHHPEELRACISSVRELYPQKRITGIFQPHLFSRTRDFADAFAESLDLLDEIILLEIYPARELPIEGINASMLLAKMKKTQKFLVAKDKLVDHVLQLNPEVLVTMGAGDIDQFVGPLEKSLRLKHQLA
ncbi:MAG: glutamate ligase domain-containing protein, partial [Bacteroidia bacterium]